MSVTPFEGIFPGTNVFQKDPPLKVFTTFPQSGKVLLHHDFRPLVKQSTPYPLAGPPWGSSLKISAEGKHFGFKPPFELQSAVKIWRTHSILCLHTNFGAKPVGKLR